ncbi:MAG: hypothetical protein Q9194_004160 [Teloschistes cf. exilis]
MSGRPEYRKRKERCGIENCRSNQYFEDDGLIYCKEGHLQRSIQETQEDQLDPGTPSRKKTQHKREREEKVSRIYRGPEALKLYLQSYQLILWKQCYALIHSMHLPAELEIVVKDLWSLRLRLLQSRVDTSTDEGPMFSSQVTSEVDTDGQQSEGRRERPSRSKVIPSLIESLGLCYIGMMLLKLPISIGDLHRWAYKEHVPYVRAVRYAILKADDIRKTVQELTVLYNHHFQVTLPALNHPLLLFKHIRDLALPLDLFVAVRRLAKLLHIDFSFPRARSYYKISSTPEVALMSLLVITVKLYHPFDSIDRHPRSLTEPGTLVIDWNRWSEVQKGYDARDTAGGKLGRGNEIKVTETDIFNLSGDQIDEYLDWFEETWVDEERARKQPRGYPSQLLDMFPTGKPDGLTRPTVDIEQERLKDEEALEAKLQAIQGTLKPRQIISDKDAKYHEEPVARIGSFYQRYRKAEYLPATAKAFHETAASLIAVKLSTLLIAVGQIERKLIRWKEEHDKEGSDSESEDGDVEQESEEESAAEEISETEEFPMHQHEEPEEEQRLYDLSDGDPTILQADSDLDSIHAQEDSP